MESYCWQSKNILLFSAYVSWKKLVMGLDFTDLHKGWIAAFQDKGREIFAGSPTSWWPQFFVSRALLVLPYRGWGSLNIISILSSGLTFSAANFSFICLVSSKTLTHEHHMCWFSLPLNTNIWIPRTLQNTGKNYPPWTFRSLALGGDFTHPYRIQLEILFWLELVVSLLPNFTNSSKKMYNCYSLMFLMPLLSSI
jgi:hypothetical protein